jgi:hypothetical protein
VYEENNEIDVDGLLLNVEGKAIYLIKLAGPFPYFGYGGASSGLTATKL